MATSQSRLREQATRPRTGPYDPYYSEYRTLITYIAEALTADDIYKLAFQNDITEMTVVPGSTVGQALSLFRILEKKNEIGPSKLSNLSDMLVRINRQDLNNSLVEMFRKRIDGPDAWEERTTDIAESTMTLLSQSPTEQWTVNTPEFKTLHGTVYHMQGSQLDTPLTDPESSYKTTSNSRRQSNYSNISHTKRNIQLEKFNATRSQYYADFSWNRTGPLNDYLSKSHSQVSLESNSNSGTHSSLVVSGKHSFHQPSGYSSQASDVSSTTCTSDLRTQSVSFETSSCSGRHHHQYNDEHFTAKRVESVSQGKTVDISQPCHSNNQRKSETRTLEDLNPLKPPDRLLSKTTNQEVAVSLRKSKEYDDVSTIRGSKESDSLINSLSSKLVDSTLGTLHSEEEEKSKGNGYGSSTVNELSENEVKLKCSEDSESPTTPLKAVSTKIRFSHSVLRTKFKQVIRPKSAKHVIWHIKRNKLNKVIYEHKENKLLQCPDKIELDIPRSGSAHKLKLSIGLYPYGLEKDRGHHATLRVDIDIPKKAPKLQDDALVEVVITVTDPSIGKQLNFCTRYVSTFTRESYMYGLLAHKDLRESKSDNIEIKCNAKFSVHGSLV